MQVFPTCMRGWEYAATLEAMLQGSAMQGVDNPYMRAELQDTYSRLNSCAGIGAAAAAAPAASASCSDARGWASVYYEYQHGAAMQGRVSPAFSAALTELDAFIAGAC